IGYVDEEDYYKGSIRQLTPEDNPYNDLQDHQDKIFKGVVITKFTDEITVELENLTWGDIPLN
ncbi:MAG: hypothetical protein GY839_19785, partial [candidate division Zixibacteria bacterium]|nr:hypothetical protein [candidate division Zixibacteria bacterium]